MQINLEGADLKSPSPLAVRKCIGSKKGSVCPKSQKVLDNGIEIKFCVRLFGLNILILEEKKYQQEDLVVYTVIKFNSK